MKAKNLILLSIFIIGCTMEQLPSNLIIAHRGVPYFAPEETIPAYLLARDLGADYLEVDIQRTSDGVIFALHDDKLIRTTNIQEVYPDRSNDPASSFTWDELQLLDAGSWFNTAYPDLARKSYAGIKILSLEELIKIAEGAGGNTGIYIETKHPELFPGIEADLKNLLLKKGWYQQSFDDGRPKIILQSFLPESIMLLKENFPETPINFLLWQGAGNNVTINPTYLLSCLNFADSIGISIMGPSFNGEKTAYAHLLDPEMVDLMHARGKQIHSYTFDTEMDILQYAPLTDGQFTNRTDLLLDYYGIAHASVDEILSQYDFAN